MDSDRRGAQVAATARRYGVSRSLLLRWSRRLRGKPDAAGRCDPDPRLRGRAIHADDTGPGQGKTRTGRLWTYVRDDRPFAGPDPPAAVFFYSPDRRGVHPEQHLAGYAGFGRLYEANRKGGPIIEAACWAQGRRKFFDLARLSKAPIAAEAVKRIDVLFAIEREINGLAAQECLKTDGAR